MDVVGTERAFQTVGETRTLETRGGAAPKNFRPKTLKTQGPDTLNPPHPRSHSLWGAALFTNFVKGAGFLRSAKSFVG